ncbi:hypothetical protein KDL21_23870 [Pseudomonas syringae pv. syringae]|nr:hypothetical protein [Pseudomonas syringae]MDC3744069.1 hypothetical protein [Pseudomonas syringae pv. syringae]
MMQERLGIPDRFKKFYADRVAAGGFVVGAVVGKNIPNYTPVTVDAAKVEEAVNDELKYAFVTGLQFTSDVNTEIANAKTVGELAAMIAKP